MADLNPNAPISLPIDKIIKMFASLLIPTFNFPTIPSALILTGAQFRTGLSPRRITSRIISRQHEAGAIQGPLPSGMDSVIEKMELIRIQEIVRALQNDAKIEVSIQPGQQITGFGYGAIAGKTITIGKGNAVIR